MDFFTTFLASMRGTLAAIPIIPAITIALSIILVFLILYATRDILLRTHSFVYQFVCIVLVALLPGLGFLLYLLIRPARTTWQKEMHQLLYHMWDSMNPQQEMAQEEVSEQNEQ